MGKCIFYLWFKFQESFLKKFYQLVSVQCKSPVIFLIVPPRETNKIVPECSLRKLCTSFDIYFSTFVKKKYIYVVNERSWLVYLYKIRICKRQVSLDDLKNMFSFYYSEMWTADLHKICLLLARSEILMHSMKVHSPHIDLL